MLNDMVWYGMVWYKISKNTKLRVAKNKKKKRDNERKEDMHSSFNVQHCIIIILETLCFGKLNKKIAKFQVTKE